MKQIVNKFTHILMSGLMVFTIALPFMQTVPVHAASDVPEDFVSLTPAPGSTITGDTLNLSWEHEWATHMDIAVGSYLTGPDYGWGENAAGSYSVDGLPTDGSTVYVRLFPDGKTPAVDVTYTFVTAAHEDAQATDQEESVAPTGLDVDNNGAAVFSQDGFYLYSQAPKTALTDDTLTIEWSHDQYDTLDVAVGSYITGPDYAWIADESRSSFTIDGLPTDGSTVYVRVFPGGDQNPGVDFSYTAARAADKVTDSSDDSSPADATAADTVVNDEIVSENDDPQAAPEPVDEPVLAQEAIQTSGAISAVWANSGEDKVVKDDLRANDGRMTTNAAWDGARVRVTGAKNEVVAFNTILEAADTSAHNVSVRFDTLSGPNGATIQTTGDNLFDWTNRPIENFYVKYLEIKGLSRLFYESYYDERHVPERFRRPHSGATGSGDWSDRPDHNKMYPDIAVPLGLEQGFSIPQGENQSIWTDVYIPKNTPAGTYTGTVTVKEGSVVSVEIPVALQVYDFTLPDDPAADTMLYISRENINERHLGDKWSADSAAKTIQDRHFQLAHRHRISLIDRDANSGDQPSIAWRDRLDGDLFTASRGYAGPGVGVGNGVYSIGTYGTWGWKGEGEAAMKQHAGAWENWFRQNAPNTERFLYLIDESGDYPLIDKWSRWLDSTGLKSFATAPMTATAGSAPHLDISASWATIGSESSWSSAVDQFKRDTEKQVYFYNSKRPVVGSFATEDDGVALRQLAWAQHKLDIDRWFYWESTYYDDFQGGTGKTNVFQTASTFGGNTGYDSMYGETGWNYSNGDGVLFYPGTDTVFPSESYGIDGPIASLRLKHWRRGIQDVDYLSLAAQVDPTATRQIVERVVPKALWEVGVSDPNDPSWVKADISWSTDPDEWRVAREQLAAIISGGDVSQVADTTTPDATPVPTYANGTLITYANDPKVYQLQADPGGGDTQVKRHIKDEHTFEVLGFSWSDIIEIPNTISYKTGAQLLVDEPLYSNGTLVKYANSSKVYVLAADSRDEMKQVKRHIVDEQTFMSLGYQWGDIITIADVHVYKTGEPLQV